MKSFTELREQQELDESWRTLGAGLLVLRIKGIVTTSLPPTAFCAAI